MEATAVNIGEEGGPRAIYGTTQHLRAAEAPRQLHAFRRCQEVPVLELIWQLDACVRVTIAALQVSEPTLSGALGHEFSCEPGIVSVGRLPLCASRWV